MKKLVFKTLKTRTSELKEVFLINELENTSYLKEASKKLRTHIKKLLPELSVSIISDYNSINVTIKKTPYKKNSLQSNLIIETIDLIINNLKINHNFYFFGCKFDYDCIFTELNEQQKDEEKQLIFEEEEKQKQAKAKKEKDFAEYLEKYKQAEIERAKREEEEKQHKQFIYDSIEIKEIEETKQYMIKDINFPSLNKNGSLKEYLEQFKNEFEKTQNELMFYRNWNAQDVLIFKEINFKNKKAYEYFTKMLLRDFDFFKRGECGSFSNDVRLEGYKNIYEIPCEIIRDCKWINKSVAIKLNNELMFVVDTQGFNYARYCGFIGKGENLI